MAADNYAKLWVQRNLNTLASTRAGEAIQNTGMALPCSVTAVNVDGFGSLVTVSFEANVPYTKPDGSKAYYTLPPLTLPKAESQWLRAPTQIGDVGLTIPADTFLGGISGLGSGVADLGVNYGNLTTLVFLPVAAKSFGASPNLNQAWVNGPDGAIVSDKAQAVLVIVDATGKAISLVVPSGGGVGIGALFSSLPDTAATLTNADFTTFQTALLAARQNDQIAFKAAMVTAGISGASSIVLPTLSAVSVPPGSTIVRIAGG